jgi:hypothetical protein
MYKLEDQLNFIEDVYLQTIKEDYPQIVSMSLDNINIWGPYVYG